MMDPDNRVSLIPGTGAQQMDMSQHGMLTFKRQMMPVRDPTNMVVDLPWLGPAMKLTALNDNLGGADGQMCYMYV